MLSAFAASPNVDIKSLWEQYKKAVERKCKFIREMVIWCEVLVTENKEGARELSKKGAEIPFLVEETS